MVAGVLVSWICLEVRGQVCPESCVDESVGFLRYLVVDLSLLGWVERSWGYPYR